MRVLNSIIVVLVVASFMLSSGAGDFCSVLCRDVVAQADVERDAYASTSTQASTEAGGEKYSTQLNATSPSNNSCDRCLEIPFSSESGRLILVKASTLKIPIIDVSTIPLDRFYTNASHLYSTKISFCNASWINTGSLPIRI